MKIVRVSFAAPLLAAAFACHHQPPAPVAPGGAGADFTGVWAFNPEQSDRPDRPGGQGGPPPGGGFGGRAGGRGRGGFGGGRGAEGGRGEGGPGGPSRRPPGDSLFRAPQQLIVTQTDSTLTFRAQGSDPLTLYFDGGVVEIASRTGGSATQIAGHWHGRRFEVERRTGGSTVTESYERSSDRTKLTVKIRISDLFGDGPELKRVYDFVARPQ